MITKLDFCQYCLWFRGILMVCMQERNIHHSTSSHNDRSVLRFNTQVQIKSPSCGDVVDILVYIDKKLSRHDHHESFQFVMKPEIAI